MTADHSTYLQVAVTQEEEDCKLLNMNVNNGDFKLLKSTLHMFFEEENIFIMFVRPNGCSRRFFGE